MKCKKIWNVRKKIWNVRNYEMLENMKCKKIWNVRKYEM